MRLWNVELEAKESDEPIQYRVPAQDESLAICMAKTQAYEDGLEVIGARVLRSISMAEARAELRGLN